MAGWLARLAVSWSFNTDLKFKGNEIIMIMSHNDFTVRVQLLHELISF